MALVLEVVNCGGEEICTACLNATSTLPELQAIIEASSGIPAAAQRLFHGQEELLGRGSFSELLQQGYTRDVLLTLVRRPQEQVEWLEKVRAGYQLKEAPEWIRGDRGVVLASVEQNGRALQFASAELRAESAVVLAAVEQDGGALQFASAELQADRAIVQAAEQSLFMRDRKAYERHACMADDGLDALAREAVRWWLCYLFP